MTEKDFTKSQMTDPTGIQLRQIPSELATQFLMVSWKISKKNYDAVIKTSLLYVLILGAMAYLPFVKILAPIPATILGAGFMVFTRKLVLGKQGHPRDLFIVFEDSEKIGDLLPLGLLGVAIAVFQAFIEKKIPGFFGDIMSLTLTLLLVALTTFSVPLVYFKRLTAVRSIELNIEATTISWQFLLAIGLMLAGLALICIVALVVPLALVFLPIALISGYLSYAALFEGLDIKEIDRKFR